MCVHRTVAQQLSGLRRSVNGVDSGATNTFDGSLPINGRFVLLDYFGFRPSFHSKLITEISFML
jgi:hypothetical protein